MVTYKMPHVTVIVVERLILYARTFGSIKEKIRCDVSDEFSCLIVLAVSEVALESYYVKLLSKKYSRIVFNLKQLLYHQLC